MNNNFFSSFVQSCKHFKSKIQYKDIGNDFPLSLLNMSLRRIHRPSYVKCRQVRKNVTSLHFNIFIRFPNIMLSKPLLSKKTTQQQKLKLASEVFSSNKIFSKTKYIKDINWSFLIEGGKCLIEIPSPLPCVCTTWSPFCILKQPLRFRAQVKIKLTLTSPRGSLLILIVFQT